MKISVKVETIRELFDVSGAAMKSFAEKLGVTESSVSYKLDRERPIYADEIGPLVATMNEPGRIVVSEERVIRLIGRRTIKVRGYMA